MNIEELQKKLDHWRKNKKSKLDRIPSKFWDEAINTFPEVDIRPIDVDPSELVKSEHMSLPTHSRNSPSRRLPVAARRKV